MAWSFGVLYTPLNIMIRTWEWFGHCCVLGFFAGVLEAKHVLAENER